MNELPRGDLAQIARELQDWSGMLRANNERKHLHSCCYVYAGFATGLVHSWHWPIAVIAFGLATTAAWICLLGYGALRLIVICVFVSSFSTREIHK